MQLWQMKWWSQLRKLAVGNLISQKTKQKQKKKKMKERRRKQMALLNFAFRKDKSGVLF